MKKLFTILLIFLIPLFNSSLSAQTDEYDWSAKFGTGLPSFINFGETKEWVEKGSGIELILGSLGYKNVHLNLSAKYFFGLKSENDITFEDYQFPDNTVYKKVFMNLTLSYEYELRNRLFIDPRMGWAKTYVSPNVKDNQGNEIELDKTTNGVIIGTKLTQYIKTTNKTYWGIFVNINYNIINYKTISEDLGGNTLGLGFGVLYKGTN
ncbi:MAG: porin family protein [Bacteroidales bacterium]|nr:porin family protein [Bacteroidales bacterium]MCF8338053.1 porin family protein [Bacteroidales bacterium]